MKRLVIAAALLISCHAWADAPVANRSAASGEVESAQEQANAAWRRLDTARYRERRAEQDVAEADKVDQQAQQRAQKADKALQAARARFAAAQEKRQQAETNLKGAMGNLDRLWNRDVRPR